MAEEHFEGHLRPRAMEEHFDIVDSMGLPTGEVRPRSQCHAEGLYHSAVHVWLLTPTGELLLQRRAACKDVSNSRASPSSAQRDCRPISSPPALSPCVYLGFAPRHH